MAVGLRQVDSLCTSPARVSQRLHQGWEKVGKRKARENAHVGETEQPDSPIRDSELQSLPVTKAIFSRA